VNGKGFANTGPAQFSGPLRPIPVAEVASTGFHKPLSYQKLCRFTSRAITDRLFAGMLIIATPLEHELQKSLLLYQRLTGSLTLPGLPAFTRCESL
jgi:hypothetical protein